MAFFGLGIGGCCMQIAQRPKCILSPAWGGHRGCFDACYMSHISFLTKETIPTTFHYYHDNYYDDGYEMYIEQLKKEIPTVKHLF